MKLLTALAASLLALSASAMAQLKASPSSEGGLTPRAALPASPGATDGSAEKEADAQRVALGWLLLLDRRDWGTAWESAGQSFRNQVPIAAWMDGIPKVREPLGSLIERAAAETSYRTSLQGRPNGEYVTAGFASKFANKPDAQEIVTTMRDPDGRWRVIGYSTK